MATDVLALLKTIRDASGEAETIGLSNHIISDFASRDDTLVRAIEEAVVFFEQLKSEVGRKFLLQSEKEMVNSIQSKFINFYAPATVNPYVAIAGRGPWVVTANGAVLHDNGGYGMLGIGHGPEQIIEAMSGNWVMANVMTPSFSQKRLTDRLQNELGHTRGECPFTKFICMNSGSEAVTVSLRISDANSNSLTAPGGRYEGKPVKLLAIEKAFHGRTDRPAQISHSCKPSYDKNLATFRDRDNLLLVPSNDVAAL